MRFNNLSQNQKKEIIFINEMMLEAVQMLLNFYSSMYLFGVKIRIEDQIAKMNDQELNEKLEIIEKDIPKFFENWQ